MLKSIYSSLFGRKEFIEPIDHKSIMKDDIATVIAEHSPLYLKSQENDEKFEMQVNDMVKKALKEKKIDQESLDENVLRVIIEKALNDIKMSKQSSLDPNFLLAQQVGKASSLEEKTSIIEEASKSLNEHLPKKERIRFAIPQTRRIVRRVASNVGKKVAEISMEQKSIISFDNLKKLGNVALLVKFGLLPKLAYGSCINVPSNLKYGIFASIGSIGGCIGLMSSVIWMNPDLAKFIINFANSKETFSNDLYKNISLSSLSNATASAYNSLLESSIDDLGRLQGIHELKWAFRRVIDGVAGIDFLYSAKGPVEIALKIAEVIESFRPFIIEAAQSYQIIANKVISMGVTATAEALKANIKVAGESTVDITKAGVDVIDITAETLYDTAKRSAQAIGQSKVVNAIGTAVENAKDRARTAIGNLLSSSGNNLLSYFGIGTNSKNFLSSSSPVLNEDTISDSESLLPSNIVSSLPQQALNVTPHPALAFRSRRKSRKSRKKSVRKERRSRSRRSQKKSVLKKKK